MGTYSDRTRNMGTTNHRTRNMGTGNQPDTATWALISTASRNMGTGNTCDARHGLQRQQNPYLLGLNVHVVFFAGLQRPTMGWRASPRVTNGALTPCGSRHMRPCCERSMAFSSCWRFISPSVPGRRSDPSIELLRTWQINGDRLGTSFQRNSRSDEVVAQKIRRVGELPSPP